MRNSAGCDDRVSSGIRVFEEFYQQYDKWFRRNKWVYRSEVEAVRKLIPHEGFGLEVGVGTGRFSVPFGIEIGVDPSMRMGSIAMRRGIRVVCGVGEDLPFREEAFDFVLNITTICFVEDPFTTLKETRRVLKNGGSVVIGFVDKKSKLGRLYETRKEKSRFYRAAKFVSVDDVLRWLMSLSFADFSAYQTIFHDLGEIDTMEPVKEGFGEGGFVALRAKKAVSETDR